MILTVQAFVDESGGKGQGRVFVLAGIIGTAEQWAAFSDDWRGVLDIPPRLKYFKMNEAAKLGGQFLRWKRGARDERLRHLARAINRYRLRVILSSIDLSAHETIFGAFGIRPWRDPYFLAFQSMNMGVCRDLLGHGHRERFEMIFDEQDIFGPRARAWYPIFKEDMEPEAQAIMPIEPIFKNDKEFLPLQAADLFAWCFRSAYSGMRDRFGWLFAEELGDTKISPESEAFTHEYLSRIVIESNRVDMSPAEAREYLRRFGLHRGRDFWKST